MKILVVIGALLAPLSSLAVSVLWYTVNSGATVTDSETGATTTVAGFLDGNGNPINAVRISIADAGSVFEQYLRLYYETEDGWEANDDVNLALLDEDNSAIWQPAELSEDIPSSAKVRVELGYFDMGAYTSTGAISFETLAFSETSLAVLVANGNVSSGGVTVQSQTPWMPMEYTTIPEPTTALLLVVGIAALALRRRVPPL